MEHASFASHVPGGDLAVLSTAAEQLPAVGWCTDRQLRITLAFGAGLAGVGLSADQATGLTLLEFFQEEAEQRLIAAHQDALQGQTVCCASVWGGRRHQFWVTPLCDGQRRIVGTIGLAHALAAQAGATGIASIENPEVTAAVDRVLHAALTCRTEEELASVCLDVAQSLTGSQIGFIGEVNPHGRLDTIAESGTTCKACQIPRSEAVQALCNMEVRGLWGQVLREGRPLVVHDPPSHPHSVGTPPGHPAIRCFLGVPFSYQGQMRGLIALANKRSGYDLGDQEAIEALAQPFAAALAHRRAVAEVQKLNRELEGRVRESREAAEALRRSEARWRAIVEDQMEYVARFLPDGRLTFVNAAICRAMKLPPGVLSGQEYTQFIHPDDVPLVRERLASLTPQAPVATMVNRNVLPSGEIRWVQWTNRGIFDEQGRLAEFQSVGRDVTERTHLERALRSSERSLRESEAMLNQAEEIAGAASFTWDMQSDSIRWSGNAHALAGLERGTLPGTLAEALAKLVHPDDVARVRADIDAMLAQRRTWPLECRIVRADGQTRLVRCNARLVLDARGRPAACVGVVHDITERRDAEQRLRQRDAEVAHLQRVHVIGEMAASLAHELNQPLHAINNYVRGARRRLERGGAGADLAQIAETMDRASAEVARTASIVSSLREFVRRREPQRASADVNKLLRRAVELLQPQIRDLGATVDWQLSSDLPPVLVDPVQVEQVMVNLVQNALHAVAGVPAERRKLTISAQRSGTSAVEIAVSDCGPGIADELAGRVFQAFVSTKKEGLGMGLAICRSIIEWHGGRIWLVHNAPQGAAFHFTLPAAAKG